MRDESGTMKRLLTICMLLTCCLSFGLAQGIQGRVKLTGKATMITTGHSVSLSWTASQGAASYSVYRGTAHGGPYTKIASGITGTNYADIQVTHNRTLYYVSTALSGSNESGYSNEIVVVIP
jgi:fibronectin type 3 domain-containing protein